MLSRSRCIHCGACIEKCPRGTLKWGPAILVRADDTMQVLSPPCCNCSHGCNRNHENKATGKPVERGRIWRMTRRLDIVRREP
jgi:formate hydrogenlyase subunit 6/NADH:ubiquinone oxidoreductase subunit I